VANVDVAGARDDSFGGRAGDAIAVDAARRPVTTGRRSGREVPETYPASRLYRVFTGLFVFGPPTLLVEKTAFAKRRFWATRANRRIFGMFYILSGLGITAGYHRLFTHRSFKTHPLLRGVFAVLGSTAIQGSVPDWVADHRKHHAYADEEGDPHSPHVGHRGGRNGASSTPTSAGCSPTRRHRGSAMSLICLTIRLSWEYTAASL
jgi:Fatty-acid desaturase